MFSAQEPKELWKEKNLLTTNTTKEIQKQPPEVLYKKAVLKSYATVPGKHLCWSLPEGLQLY